MKKIVYISALALSSAFSFSSCEDYLEAENKGQGGQTADEYFSQSGNLVGYRNYVYSKLFSLVGPNYIDINDWGTDIYWPTRGKQTAYDYYNFTTTDDQFKKLYTGAYALVNGANGVMSYGSQYDSDMKFARAYGYYILTQQFGSVPYITHYINDATMGYPRVELSKIYDGILADLDAVLADPNVPAISNDGMVNKKAAAALAAKIALAAGWDVQTTVEDAQAGTYNVAGTEYFAKAAAYAETALEGVALLENFADKWSPSNDGNQETFYAIPYDRSVISGAEIECGHSLQNTYGSYYGSQSELGSKNCGSVGAKSLKSLFLWSEDDARYDATFQNIIYNYDGNWGTSGYYAYLNVPAADQDKLNISFYYAKPSTSEADFDAFVNDAVAAGRFEYFEKEKNPSCKWKNATGAYLLGSTCKVYSFNPDGTIAGSRKVDYETLQEEVNASDCVKKWDDPKTLQGAISNGSYRDVVLLHASETILTAAEAYLMAGNEAKALEMINKVRSRAKTGSVTSFDSYKPDYVGKTGTDFAITPIDLVLDERARELFGEPGRWVDLRRTKQLVKYVVNFSPKKLGVGYSSITNGRGEIKWLRPIPAEEIGSNMSISNEDQNPGY